MAFHNREPLHILKRGNRVEYVILLVIIYNLTPDYHISVILSDAKNLKIISWHRCFANADLVLLLHARLNMTDSRIRTIDTYCIIIAVRAL